MKTVSVRELQQNVRDCVQAAQKEQVILTRHGKPAVVLVGVEGKDWETVVLETSTAFWKLIEKRRREKDISSQELRKRLQKRPAPKHRRPSRV